MFISKFVVLNYILLIVLTGAILISPHSNEIEVASFEVKATRSSPRLSLVVNLKAKSFAPSL